MTARTPEPAHAELYPHYDDAPDGWQPGDAPVRMRAAFLYAKTLPPSEWFSAAANLDVGAPYEPFIPEARAQLIAEHAAGIDTVHRVCHAIRGCCECARDAAAISHPHCDAMRRAAEAVRTP